MLHFETEASTHQEQSLPGAWKSCAESCPNEAHRASPHFLRLFHAFHLPCRWTAAIVPAVAGPFLRSKVGNSNTLEKEIRATWQSQ